MGSNIWLVKIAGACAPLLLATGSLAAFLPYAQTGQKDPSAELTALQSEWAGHISTARLESNAHGTPPTMDRGRSVKGSGHGRFFGKSDSDSSAESSAGSNGESVEKDESSNAGAGHAFDFGTVSWLSNYATQTGGGLGGLWSGWPGSALEEHFNLSSFGGLQTMLKDAPAVAFEPLTPNPEPASAVYLLAGIFAFAVFTRRFQLQRRSASSGRGSVSS